MTRNYSSPYMAELVRYLKPGAIISIQENSTPKGAKRWHTYLIPRSEGGMLDVTREICSLLNSEYGNRWFSYSYDSRRRGILCPDGHSGFLALCRLERMLWPGIRRRRGYDLLKGVLV